MFVVDKKKNEVLSLPAKEILPGDAKHLSSGLAVKILRILSEEPAYTIEIAKRLKVNEQKIYYHIGQLEKAGLVRFVKSEGIKGATAKYYAEKRQNSNLQIGDKPLLAS